MSLLVVGLVNHETTVQVEGFPLTYAPVRYPFHGIRGTTSGVGANLALGLRSLGHEVRLLTLLGADQPGQTALAELAAAGVDTRGVLVELAATPQSVILVDPTGQRTILVDLKDMQQQRYPVAAFRAQAAGASWALMGNLELARPLLAEARELGLRVVTDVHAVADLEDPYNRDFMAAATVLFMSHESLPCAPEDWARSVLERYHPEVLVIGQGAEGALLAWPAGGVLARYPAIATRPVRNTVGGGDALVAGFVHALVNGHDPVGALHQAQLFASWKVGEHGGARGFLDAAALEQLAAGRSFTNA